MTITQQQAETDAPSAWRRMRLWALAHAIDDLYQGLVPSIVPYFVLDRHYGYVAASGLTLAATLGSSLPQPVLGVIADRRNAGWMAGAGVGLAGLGLSVAGLLPGYGAVWCAILLSGLGISMFHPAAGQGRPPGRGRQRRRDEPVRGRRQRRLLPRPGARHPRPDRARPARHRAVPAAGGAHLLRAAAKAPSRDRRPRRRRSQRTGRDRWGPFAALTGVEVLRSTTFFGLNTFIELYWIRDLHASRGLAGIALTCFLAGGVAGTLLGGRIADRVGAVRTVQLGTALILPVLGGLLLVPGAFAPLPFALATGIALNIPFAVLIKLGQDYLPTRPGTAAGVTLGLGVSVGGLAAPLLALIANSHGPRGALLALLVVPPLAIVCGLLLRDPPRAAEPRKSKASRSSCRTDRAFPRHASPRLAPGPASVGQ